MQKSWNMNFFFRKDNLIEDYGSFCQGGAYVMIYFAITWFCGLIAYMRTESEITDFYPVFQVLNAFMVSSVESSSCCVYVK